MIALYSSIPYRAVLKYYSELEDYWLVHNVTLHNKTAILSLPLVSKCLASSLGYLPIASRSRCSIKSTEEHRSFVITDVLPIFIKYSSQPKAVLLISSANVR